MKTYTKIASILFALFAFAAATGVSIITVSATYNIENIHTSEIIVFRFVAPISLYVVTIVVTMSTILTMRDRDIRESKNEQ